MVSRRLESCDVPVALHLDHGKNLRAVEDALAAKFTSIMIDASEEPYEENVAISAKARRMAGPDIAVEAELGSIGGKEDEMGPDEASGTDPDQVAVSVAQFLRDNATRIERKEVTDPNFVPLAMLEERTAARIHVPTGWVIQSSFLREVDMGLYVDIFEVTLEAR